MDCVPENNCVLISESVSALIVKSIIYGFSKSKLLVAFKGKWSCLKLNSLTKIYEIHNLTWAISNSNMHTLLIKTTIK